MNITHFERLITSLCMKFHDISSIRLQATVVWMTLLSPSFWTNTITHRHTCPWKRWQNWTNYDSNWLLTHRILQTWPPATIICSQTSSGGSRKRDSDRMRKSSRKPRRISKERNAWTFAWFVLQKGHQNWKIAIPSVSPSKATMLRNKYNFAQKTLGFIKNPGTFQPM